MSTAAKIEDAKAAAEHIGADARRAVRKVAPWIVYLGRFGLVAKGLVYVIVGWLAIQSARLGGQLPDQQGALRSILRQPFGRTLLIVMSVGLFAYMIWRIVQAAFNPEQEPNTLGGWAKRAFRLGSGLIYGGLGVAAARLLVGMQAKRRSPSDWTEMVMSKPFGKWLVVAAGIAIAGLGAFRLYKAWEGELKKHLILDGYAARARAWITGLGRVGQAARGVVFIVMGLFAFFAGLHANPREAKGVAEALGAIERAPYGPYLLGAVAAGLIAYGLFQFVEARYRRIRAE
jgi:hypothetical protein